MNATADAAFDVLAAWRRSHPEGLGALVDDDAIAAFGARAQALGIADSSIYAESRLTGQPQLDFLVSLRREHFADPEITGRMGRWGEIGGRMGEAWKAVERFGRRWRVPGDDVHGLVSTAWLELDDVLGGDATFGPSLSACVVPGYPAAPVDDATSRRERIDRVARVQEALDDKRDPIAAASLRLCCDALPAEGRVIHLSRMNARAPAAAKVYATVPRRELVAYLRLVGWRGPLAAVERVLSRIATQDLCGALAYVDLDLVEARIPGRATLGIAFSQQQAEHDPARPGLLRRLVDERLATQAQAELLADWVGPWSAGERPRIERWFDVKLVLGGRRDLYAKAYLGYRVDWNPFVVGY